MSAPPDSHNPTTGTTAIFRAGYSRFQPYAGSVVILALALLTTLLSWLSFRHQLHARDLSRFHESVAATRGAIHQRMLDYKQVMRGAEGLMAASGDVDHQSWRDYVDTLDIDLNLPGLHGLGYVARVTDEELDGFISRAQADSSQTFSLSPPGRRPDYFVIQFVEPLSKNTSVLGFDLGNEAAPAAAHAPTLVPGPT
jgi:CHASE1-domain containing sensor protein